tara:strand:- start:5883 stop:6968 length:1086 start_codon:yes stop_codon:yes gene_type:complete
VIIKEIKLDSFRSYEFLEIPIKKGITLFYGDNGSGKSSVIESVYFSLTGKSFRTNDTNSLIQNKKTQTQTLLVFEGGKSIKITKKKNSRPHILHNRGEKTENFTKLVKKYPNCLIENKEFFFTTSNPEQKRNFLNKTLFYVEQTDRLLLNEVKKIILQRSGCLKNKDFNQIKYWDEKLVEIEPKVTKLNETICQKINMYLKNSSLITTFEGKNPWIKDLGVKYDPGYDNSHEFIDILEKNFEKDCILKRTTEGPHKRSLNIFFKNLDASEVLSRGQQKIISIIFHLIQREIIIDHTNLMPILLMDDISSELDKENANLMLKYLINNSVQTIMTSISSSHFSDHNEVFLFHVEHNGECSYVK